MPTTKTSSKTSTKKKTTPKPLKRVIIKQTDRTIRFSYISLIILFIIILLGGLYFYNFTYVRGDQGENEAVQVQEEKHVAFLLEIFDKIQENYWEVITGQDLFNIYKAGLEKLEKHCSTSALTEETLTSIPNVPVVRYNRPLLPTTPNDDLVYPSLQLSMEWLVIILVFPDKKSRHRRIYLR